MVKIEVPVTAVWLKGGKNEVTVLIEVDGEFVEVIKEYMPVSGGDGEIWPISHIKEMPPS